MLVVAAVMFPENYHNVRGDYRNVPWNYRNVPGFCRFVQAETSKKPTAVDTAPRHRVRKTLPVA